MSTGQTSQNSEVDEASQARDTARYIADITGGFANIARKAKLDVLAYILDMAKLEAEETAQSKPEGQ
jgi:hypothetical protein